MYKLTFSELWLYKIFFNVQYSIHLYFLAFLNLEEFDFIGITILIILFILRPGLNKNVQSKITKYCKIIILLLIKI